MKKKEKSFYKVIQTSNIYLDHIEQIINILQKNDQKVLIETEEYELKNISELCGSTDENNLKKLTLSSESKSGQFGYPKFRISFSESACYISCTLHNEETQAIINQLIKSIPAAKKIYIVILKIFTPIYVAFFILMGYSIIGYIVYKNINYFLYFLLYFLIWITLTFSIDYIPKKIFLFREEKKPKKILDYIQNNIVFGIIILLGAVWTGIDILIRFLKFILNITKKT